MLCTYNLKYKYILLEGIWACNLHLQWDCKSNGKTDGWVTVCVPYPWACIPFHRILHYFHHILWICALGLLQLSLLIFSLPKRIIINIICYFWVYFNCLSIVFFAVCVSFNVSSLYQPFIITAYSINSSALCIQRYSVLLQSNVWWDCLQLAPATFQIRLSSLFCSVQITRPPWFTSVSPDLPALIQSLIYMKRQ